VTHADSADQAMAVLRSGKGADLNRTQPVDTLVANASTSLETTLSRAISADSHSNSAPLDDFFSRPLDIFRPFSIVMRYEQFTQEQIDTMYVLTATVSGARANLGGIYSSAGATIGSLSDLSDDEIIREGTLLYPTLFPCLTTVSSCDDRE